MTVQDGLAFAGRPFAGRRNTGGPEHTPRLRLKPKTATIGHVDGAWWPHSDDLASELTDLLAVLSVRLGAVDRVLYNLSEWPKAPARLLTGRRAVRLDGYRLQPANTIEVLGIGRDRMLLLVVPPHTDPDHAHESMMTAAASDNASSADRLLEIRTEVREFRDRAATTQQHWLAGARAAR